MKITYLEHSGYIVELDCLYLLFDAYKPCSLDLNKNKDLYIFVSHHHYDHYDPWIFTISHPKKHYVFSKDILCDRKDILWVEPYQHYILNNLRINTLNSTDEGVAFIVEYQDKKILHMGDLHLWLWNEDTMEEATMMQSRYEQEIERIKEINFDVVFSVLDPRQEELEMKGMEYLFHHLHFKKMFPMHFGDDFSIIDRYKQLHPCDELIKVEQKMQTWEV